MFVLLILAIRFFSHQYKQDSKTIIIDDEKMNSNQKIEKNSNSFTNLSNYENPALLSDNVFDGLEEITNRSKWHVTASSYQEDNAEHNEGPPDYIKDGDRNTRWHSRYDSKSGGYGDINKPPFYFLIDLNETVRLGGFQYAPRLNGKDGRFRDYKLFTGSSKADINYKITNDHETEQGKFIYSGDNDNDYKSVRLQQEVECSFIALETDGYPQESHGKIIYTAVCSDFRVYVNRNIESPTESETESPTESETESPTEIKTESPTESETESPTEIKTESPTEIKTESQTENETESPTEIKTESPTESETKSKTESESETETGSQNENETENETKTKSEIDTEIDFSSSETEETNINSEKVTQTESDKEEQEYTQSTDEKDDDQSQSDIQYQTSLETKIVTSIITEEIIHPDEETNSPSNVIIMSTNELTSNTPQNTTNVIDNTETELERESSIESSIHIEDSTDSMNTALITGVTVGVIVLIIIVVLLIIFLIYRHKRLEYNSAENDFSVEMDDGALNIDTNNDAHDAYNHSDQSDIGENPFMKDDFIETNNTSDVNVDSNNVDDS